MFEFFNRQITYFLIPAYHLLQARLGATIAINAQDFIRPLSILLIGYGLSMTALVCAVVETIALVILVFTYGMEGSIMNLTIPFIFSRPKVIAAFVYVAVASHISPLATKSTIFIESAFIVRPTIEFDGPAQALHILHIPYYILTFLFGEDYLTSTTSYLKTLPYHVGNYAIRQVEKKLFYPCGGTLKKMKEDPSLAFTLRVAFPLFAVIFFWTSIVAAFFVAYALDLATNITATGNKHRGLFIEGIWEPEHTDTTLSIAEDDGASTALSFMGMDTTLCSMIDDDGGGKVKCLDGVVKAVESEQEGGIRKGEDSEFAHTIVPLDEEPAFPKVKVFKQIRLTPFAPVFVPKLKGLEASMHAPASRPAAPATQTRSTSAHWAPAAPTVPIVLEAPPRR
ncbi:hypothetical protein D9613_005675 [Agrocybe pediades]|uniref:Uncharacterized protein n=1 Tax=Agrocybe pediades TaxID=84607 RepID=A0A8H4QVY2_9AGAR|nr:hypothetical protein D9613_005675 [Agrocybe pediades]